MAQGVVGSRHGWMSGACLVDAVCLVQLKVRRPGWMVDASNDMTDKPRTALGPKPHVRKSSSASPPISLLSTSMIHAHTSGGCCAVCLWEEAVFPQVSLQCCAVLSHSVMTNSLQAHGLQPSRLLCPWDFPDKNTGVGCHALLQGIFPTQGSNPGLLHCRQILYCLSHQGSPRILEWVAHPFSRGSF